MTDPSPQPAEPDKPAKPPPAAEEGEDHYLLDRMPSTPSRSCSAEIRLVAIGAAHQKRWWVLMSVVLVLAFVIVATAYHVSPYVTGPISILALIALMMAEILRRD